MIVTLALLGLLSAAFFVAWQYTESTLLIAAYVLSVTGVCVVNRLLLRQSEQRVLRRFERILDSGHSDCIADEDLSETERRMISRLCELEAREERVRQGFQNISSLVSDISHQCKTPLSSILMYTELSRDRGDIVIHRQTEKLQFLIESLTKLAKCEGGLIAENLSPRMNSVRELVARSVESVIDAADRRGISIVCDIGGAEVNGEYADCNYDSRTAHADSDASSRTDRADCDVGSNTARIDCDASSRTVRVVCDASSRTDSADSDSSSDTDRADCDASSAPVRVDYDSGSHTIRVDCDSSSRTARADSDSSSDTDRADCDASSRTARVVCNFGSHTARTHTGTPDLFANFDLRWTAEALGNILDNAVKYSDGGKICVKACDCDTFVRIDVTDHGRGIPESELCNIWKRFWRGKDSHDLPGVGVGLYLTSRILSAEGGRAVAKSSPDGSTFSVFLSKL